MFNKKRLFVAGAFIIALLFMTMYAGGTGEQETTAMRIVKFIDGFNNAEISTQNIEVGGSAEVPTDPKHENLLFIGWYDGDTRVTKFTNIMEDLTVKSKYVDDINNNGIDDSEDNRYTVTFYDTQAESNISQVEVLTGMNAVAPTPRVHDGLTFTGWSRGFTNVTSNFRVDALYRTTEELASDEVSTYTVRFFVGTEEISTQTIEEGAAAIAPDAPSISKKVFTGWDTSFDKVTTDLTVNAVYAEDINENGLNDETETRYTVTFVAGTGGTLNGTLEFTNLLINLSLEDNGVTIPEPVANTGYEFSGWNAPVTNETKVAGNTTYTANFKDIENPIIQITYPLEGKVYNKADVKITKNSSDNEGLNTIYTALYKEDGTLVKDKTKELNGIKTKETTSDYLTTTDLPDGNYYFEVYVTDLTGNESVYDRVNFIIDSSSPIAKIILVDEDNNQYNENGVKFGENVAVIGEVDASEKHIKSHWFEITNPDGTLSYANNMNTTELNYRFNLDTSKGSGEYKIRYVATDRAGNRNDDPHNTNSTIRTLIVDVDGPIISSLEALNYYHQSNDGYDHYDNKPIEIKVTSTDNYSENLLYQYGGETTWVESNTYIRQWTAEDFLVKVKDEFGNITTATIGIHIDKEPMTINFETTGGESYNGDYTKVIKSLYIKPRNAWKLLESGYLWSEKADGITQEELVNSFWHNNQITVPTADGTYYLWSYAIDYHGNERIQRSNAFIIDNVKPEVENTHYSTTDPTNKAVLVTITFNEAVTINNGWSQKDINDKTVWQKSFDSNVTELVKFQDLAGNENETTISIDNINTVPPVITFSGEDHVKMWLIDPTFKVSNSYGATDDIDGDIKGKVIIEIDSGLERFQGTNLIGKKYDYLLPKGLKAGTYEIKFTVTDSAGNTTERIRYLTYK